MTNINDLILRIRIKINDTSSSEFQDSEILSYINEGISMLEIILLSNKAVFNIAMISSASNICPVPDDMLDIYKVLHNKKSVPLKNIDDFTYGYYIINNNIILPCTNAEIYYIKEFERYNLNDNITLSNIYIDYLYNFAVIKALSRFEYNMENEKSELMQLSSMIVKTALNKQSNYMLKRYNGFSL